MSIRWESYRGNERSENRDFGFFMKCFNTDILVVVDGGNNGDRPKDFVVSFVDSLRKAIKKLTKIETPKAFIKALGITRATLKGKYIKETLCYSVLLLNHSKRACWAVSCGDCRVGSIDGATGEVIWRTNVHTLANWDGQFFSGDHLCRDGISVVTRCFSLKRYCEPEIVQLDYEVGTWCLATDGYWLEKQMQGMTICSDDTSILVYNNNINDMEIFNPENFFYEK